MANVDFVVLLNTDERESITVGPAAYNPEDVSIRVSSGQVIICTHDQAQKLYRALNAHLYSHQAVARRIADACDEPTRDTDSRCDAERLRDAGKFSWGVKHESWCLVNKPECGPLHCNCGKYADDPRDGFSVEVTS